VRAAGVEWRGADRITCTCTAVHVHTVQQSGVLNRTATVRMVFDQVAVISREFESACANRQSTAGRHPPAFVELGDPSFASGEFRIGFILSHTG
jgi:hypothetical protein